MVSLRRSTDSGGGTGYISPSSFRETNTPAWREYLDLPIYEHLSCCNKLERTIKFDCNKRGLTYVEIDKWL
uniref:Uncharacterized protein n=1 Tax=Rhizophagus irregularis (strain DAOM 181602 / DAOM 197198 / MUCL 43194) TaxID=747089 RepID=U9UE27_RHIID